MTFSPRVRSSSVSGDRPAPSCCCGSSQRKVVSSSLFRCRGSCCCSGSSSRGSSYLLPMSGPASFGCICMWDQSSPSVDLLRCSFKSWPCPSLVMVLEPSRRGTTLDAPLMESLISKVQDCSTPPSRFPGIVAGQTFSNPRRLVHHFFPGDFASFLQMWVDGVHHILHQSTHQTDTASKEGTVFDGFLVGPEL